MKKRISILVLIISLIAVFLTACGGKNNGGGVYHNITAQSNPYSMGKQSIELVASSSSVVNDEPSAKFKQSISVNDVEVGGALNGKTVTNVVFNSETSVTVTLDGNTKAEGGDGVYGTITVKQSGMASKGSSTCTVNVLAPVMFVSGFFGVGGGGNFLVSATLQLTAGEFTSEATAENIILAGDATGELNVTLSEGELKIEVKNCNERNPSVIFKSQVTTFGKEYTIKLASAASTHL